MIELILSNVFASISLLALIISTELVINFKKPLILKVLFFAISFNIFTLNLSILLNLHYFVTEISRSLLVISSFILISFLYAGKVKKDVLYLCFIFFILVISLLLGDYFEENHHDRNYRIIVVSGRILLLLISLYLFSKQHFLLFKSLNGTNYYSIKIKKWTKFTIIIFTMGIINNFISIFKGSEYFLNRGLSALIHFSICMFILYRPSFLNRNELTIKLSKKLRENMNSVIEADKFVFQFYTSTYFINKNASIEDLAKILKVGTQALSSYIYENTKMNFSDLINKSRVDYFITLAQSQQFDDYTIESLSELVGFSSRQSLYRNFKKFHGGSPSDLLKAVK